MTTISEATERYEAWLGQRITLIPEDLARKHEAMKSGIFPFLRATYYRWAQTWPEVCPKEYQAPFVLGIGDLHVENFGTWRDVEGRLAWGVNDFDEACRVPYTCDLVRLATSAQMAIATDKLKFSGERSCDSLLKGYQDALEAGGGAYVLSEKHQNLRQMAVERLKDPNKFWDKMKAWKDLPEPMPAGVEDALRRVLPDPQMTCAFAHRLAGLGSLGRRRYIAVGEWHGGLVAREAKELASSAWAFAHPDQNDYAIHYQEMINRSIRCPDPFVQLKGKWIVRRLAPDCSRIELSSLPKEHDGYSLLHAMGWETANVHLGSVTAEVLAADLKQRKDGWLHRAGEAMVDSTQRDWDAWKSAGR